MKILMWLIGSLFWLWIFIVPTAIFGFGAFLLYNKSINNLPFSILISLTGLASGYWLAETIRKKFGLVDFFGKLLSTPELDEEKKK